MMENLSMRTTSGSVCGESGGASEGKRRAVPPEGAGFRQRRTRIKEVRSFGSYRIRAILQISLFKRSIQSLRKNAELLLKFELFKAQGLTEKHISLPNIALIEK
jgi:hypothetical protein